MEHRPAYWTHDDKAVDDVGHLYYFAPANRRLPPYTTQRHVSAIIDIADDGTLAGVELIENMPPPPMSMKVDKSLQQHNKKLQKCLVRVLSILSRGVLTESDIGRDTFDQQLDEWEIEARSLVDSP